VNGHWETGKADGKIALKPGDFGMRSFQKKRAFLETPGFVEIRTLFSGFGDNALRKMLFSAVIL
jgi:hypothetical protein